MRISALFPCGALAIALASCAPRATVSGDEPRRLSDEAESSATPPSQADAGAPPPAESVESPEVPQEVVFERALTGPMPVRAPGNVVFPAGGPRLPDADATRAALEQAAAFLRDHSDLALRVEGHSDSRGKAAANLEVSGKRALLVKAWLVQHGIDGGRLLAIGFGDTKPIATNTTPAGRAQNRRVEFTILAGTEAGREPNAAGTVFE